MKKLAALLLAIVMVMSLATVAFANGEVNPPEAVIKTTPVTNDVTNGEHNTSGEIVITGLHLDAEGKLDGKYDVYKIAHLEGYDATANAYSYVVIDEWKDFFVTGAGKDYATFNELGYLIWNTNEADETVETFAKEAQAYAKSEGISPIATSNMADAFDVADGSGTFDGLSLGYYLVDSNVGALCGLTTTKPTGLINAKNGAPTLDKQVQEDSAVESGTNSWFDENTADIGQYVNYDVTINVHAGAQNYVFHDLMSEGLTFEQIVDAEGKPLHGLLNIRHFDTLTGVTSDVLATDYTLITEPKHADCTFEIAFTQAFCDSLQTNDKLYITYDAKLNDKAVIAGDGNPNEAWLDYGEGHHTTHDTVTTYTYSFDLVKTDGNSQLIDGATFKVYTQETGGEPVYIVKKTDGTYRKASVKLDTEIDVDSLITVTGGMVTIEGFDNGVYYLEEVTAPSGYNKLEKRVKFTISDANLSATLVNGVYTPNTGVQVKNSTGSTLPNTGAMGTALFLTFGSVVVIATGLLLVTKKRMSMIQE